MDIKIIALDLDGTVLNSKKQLTKRTEEAIREAIRAGIYVIPSTGRTLCNIPADLIRIPGIRYINGANGAAVTDLQTGKVIYHDFIPMETALLLLERLKKFDVEVSMYAHGKMFDYEGFEKRVSKYFPGAKKMPRIYVPDLATCLKLNGWDIEKLFIFFLERILTKEIQADIAHIPGISTCSSDVHNLEINSSTVDKGKSLLKLGELLGVSKDQIMAMGDGGNDLSMLRAVGHPVAMENAIPEVKEIAEFVTASCDEDGVALMIEKVLG